VNGAWIVEVIDADGLLTSIALDSQGVPHVAYSDGTIPVRLATRTGVGTWAIESLSTTNDTWVNSLALDGNDAPHIAYAFGGWLYYIEKTGGVWTNRSVENVSGGTVNASLALDASGFPHISYSSTGVHEQRYAFLTSLQPGATWTYEIVDALGTIGSSNSIAIDALGNPHVAYENRALDIHKYAVRIGGVWQPETIAATGNVSGPSVSIDLDSQGDPHVVYNDFNSFFGGDLWYAVKKSGLWNIERVDTIGYACKLDLDAVDTPHVVFVGSLRYATFETNCQVAPSFIALHDSSGGVAVGGHHFRAGFNGNASMRDGLFRQLVHAVGDRRGFAGQRRRRWRPGCGFL
jgi:hypothetical protein